LAAKESLAARKSSMLASNPARSACRKSRSWFQISGSQEVLRFSPKLVLSVLGLLPFALLDLLAEEDAVTEGSNAAREPTVFSLAARRFAAAALRLGLLLTASSTSLVRAGELNSSSQPVEISLCEPFAAACHEPGILMGEFAYGCIAQLVW